MGLVVVPWKLGGAWAGYLLRNAFLHIGSESGDESHHSSAAEQPRLMSNKISSGCDSLDAEVPAFTRSSCLSEVTSLLSCCGGGEVSAPRPSALSLVSARPTRD